MQCKVGHFAQKFGTKRVRYYFFMAKLIISSDVAFITGAERSRGSIGQPPKLNKKQNRASADNDVIVV